MRWLKQIHWPEFEMMGLLLALWLCVVPFIALLVIPVFGNQVGVALAVALLVVMMMFCWVLCILAATRILKQQQMKGH
jgi:hypothetical protein